MNHVSSIDAYAQVKPRPTSSTSEVRWHLRQAHPIPSKRSPMVELQFSVNWAWQESEDFWLTPAVLNSLATINVVLLDNIRGNGMHSMESINEILVLVELIIGCDCQGLSIRQNVGDDLDEVLFELSMSEVNLEVMLELRNTTARAVETGWMTCLWRVLRHRKKVIKDRPELTSANLSSALYSSVSEPASAPATPSELTGPPVTPLNTLFFSGP